jgi:hypothetical protein
MSLLKSISEQIPIQGRIKNLLLAGGYLSAFNPYYSVASKLLEDIEGNANWAGFFPKVMQSSHLGLWLASGLCLPYALAKLMYPVLDANGNVAGQKKSPNVVLGDMNFEEKELFTNIMITGAIGSGKTSSAIYPLLRQLFDIYNVTDDDPTNPHQKLGGLVMDVKGDFYEALICFMYWAGRNVLDDLVVITPWSNYEFVEFVDPETNLYWCVSARGGGDEGSNELVRLIKGNYLPDPETGESDGLNPLPVSYIIANDRTMDKTIGPMIEKTNREYIQEMEFRGGADLCYIGWRKEDDGYLYRVSHSDKKGKAVFLLDESGARQRMKPPQSLKFSKVRGVNNGLTFNICPPSLGPTELANRLVSMGKNASGGGGGGGDNSFWDDATKKHIGWTAQLFRTVNPDAEITAIEINRMTVDQKTIDDQVNKLKDYIDEVERKARLCTEPGEKQTLNAELDILTDMRRYFEGEWATLDVKTKSNLISTITNVFGQFMNDSKLRSTFCVPSSFNLGEVMQSGKIFTLVAPEYEAAARVFGTSLKMEFQALLRRRTAQAHFNKIRFILFACDEAQNFVVCGGNDPSSGDENFMALSRQSRVANIIATQTDASIINVVGDKAADVYYAQFGTRVWYQNTDDKTNKRATAILGKVKREKVSRSGQDFQVATIFSKDGGTAKGYNETVNVEEKERFPPETFPNLNVHECVIYNKGKLGPRAKAVRNAVLPDPLGAPWEVDNKNKVIRWYFQAYIENQLYKTKQSYILDPEKKETAPIPPEQAKAAALIEEVDFDKNVAVPKIPQKPIDTGVAKPPVLGPLPTAPNPPVDLGELAGIGGGELPDLDTGGLPPLPQPLGQPTKMDATDDLTDLFNEPEGSTPQDGADGPADADNTEEDEYDPARDTQEDILGLHQVSCIFMDDEDEQSGLDSQLLDFEEEDEISDPLEEMATQNEMTEEGMKEVKSVIGDLDLTERFRGHVSVIEGISRLGVDFEAIQSEHFNPNEVATVGGDIIGQRDEYSPSETPIPIRVMNEGDNPVFAPFVDPTPIPKDQVIPSAVDTVLSDLMSVSHDDADDILDEHSGEDLLSQGDAGEPEERSADAAESAAESAVEDAVEDVLNGSLKENPNLEGGGGDFSEDLMGLAELMSSGESNAKEAEAVEVTEAKKAAIAAAAETAAQILKAEAELKATE